MTEKDVHVQETTREKLQEVTESAIYKLVWPTVMSAALFFLGWTVNRLSDHFDRIDSHLAASDTSTTVLRRDVDVLNAQVPAQAAQIKAIQAEADHTAWSLDEIQHDRGHR